MMELDDVVGTRGGVLTGPDAAGAELVLSAGRMRGVKLALGNCGRWST